MVHAQARDPNDSLSIDHDGEGLAHLAGNLPIDQKIVNFGRAFEAERPIAISRFSFPHAKGRGELIRVEPSDSWGGEHSRF
jgi:hypothetical protein